MAGLNPLDRDAEAKPPNGQSTQIEETAGTRTSLGNLRNKRSLSLRAPMNVSRSSFGKITSEQDGTPGSQAGPRSIQMALRLIF
jgi:hypothetical protein